MFITREEFLKSFGDKERNIYQESIQYFSDKSSRDGRMIAEISDVLYNVILSSGPNTPPFVNELYTKLNQYFDNEINIMKERHARIMANRN